MSGNQQPTYDPIVANQENFDPITLIPVFNAQQPALQSPSGQPINFYVPPPPTAETLPGSTDIVPAWRKYLPFIIGSITILLLVGIWLIIRRTET